MKDPSSSHQATPVPHRLLGVCEEKRPPLMGNALVVFGHEQRGEEALIS